MGYVSTNQDLYSSLQKSGYVLILKPTIPDKTGDTKGNIDADLMSPYNKTCSSLLKKSAKEKIVFMDNLRQKLEYKNIK